MIRHYIFLNLALPIQVTLPARCLQNIEYEQASQVAMPARQLAEMLASFRVQRCTICHREAAVVHTFIDDVVKEVERVTIDLLVSGIVADKLAAMIGRDDDGWPEALGREGAFAGTSWSAEHEDGSTGYFNGCWHGLVCFLHTLR